MTIQKGNTAQSIKQQIINKDIFKAYDIRGEIGKDWCLADDAIDNNYNDAFLIGQALGSHLVNENSKQIIVGRDGRKQIEVRLQSN